MMETVRWRLSYVLYDIGNSLSNYGFNPALIAYVFARFRLDPVSLLCQHA